MVKVLVGIVALILIAGGGYYYWSDMSAGEPAPTDTSQAAQPSPQVAGQDAVVGTGAEATPGSVVSILYVGMLQDGTVFDSSANNNNEPLVFTLGAPGIIPGFQIGVNGMKVGGERRIQIPPELGYGVNAVHQNPSDQSSPVIIPANSTLTFDIKLVSVTPPATAPAAETPSE